jgi:long-subunit fatty acid transport protein
MSRLRDASPIQGRVAIALLALALSAGVAAAQEKVGTCGANFLQIGVSPRAAALGDAYLAIVDDATAVYYNPGALARVQEREFFASHVSWPADISFEYATVVAPLMGGTMAGHFSALHTDRMNVTTPFDHLGTGETFGVLNWAAGLAYSTFLTDKFSLGASVKWVQMYLEDEAAHGWAADVGTFYDTGYHTLRIAMSITNFGPDMTFIEEAFALPMDFKIGGAVDLMDRPGHRLTLAVQGSHPSDNQERQNVGLEYRWHDMAMLRGGYKFEYDEETYAFGGGFQHRLGSVGLGVDYAYSPFEHLGDAHRFSLGLTF